MTFSGALFVMPNICSFLNFTSSAGQVMLSDNECLHSFHQNWYNFQLITSGVLGKASKIASSLFNAFLYSSRVVIECI